MKHSKKRCVWLVTIMVAIYLSFFLLDNVIFLLRSLGVPREIAPAILGLVVFAIFRQLFVRGNRKHATKMEVSQMGITITPPASDTEVPGSMLIQYSDVESIEFIENIRRVRNREEKSYSFKINTHREQEHSSTEYSPSWSPSLFRLKRTLDQFGYKTTGATFSRGDQVLMIIVLGALGATLYYWGMTM